MDIFEAIPGYREAIDKETQTRRRAFLCVPELICGIAVMPLTLDHLLLLQFANSPFLTRRAPSALEIGQFLLVVSVEYDRVRKLPASSLKFKVMRWRFLRSIRRLDYRTVVAAINSYVDEAFQDSPGGDSTFSRIEYFSGIAATVAALAAELHWSEEAILRMPIKRAFQYQRCITRRHDSRAVFFNPSDSIRGKWLAKQQPARKSEIPKLPNVRSVPFSSLPFHLGLNHE